MNARVVFEVVVHAVTACGLAALAATAVMDADLFAELTRKDGPKGAGLVENLTVFVLVPSIAAAFYGFLRWRQNCRCGGCDITC